MEILSVTEDNIKEYEAFLERSMNSSRNEVTAVKNYIYQHYEEDLNLEMLAEKVYLSSGYLSFIFKKETGMTILEYITNERVTMAAELLVETNFPIVTVADSVGYGNYSYFTKIFKRYMGDNPKTYRQKHKTAE